MGSILIDKQYVIWSKPISHFHSWDTDWHARYCKAHRPLRRRREKLSDKFFWNMPLKILAILMHRGTTGSPLVLQSKFVLQFLYISWVMKGR